MKVVIFAGGLGSRITEESHLRPKPMIEIGGRPIIWHIMKIYASQGFNDFVICLGYKGHVIKEYFLNYYLYNSDLTVDVKNNDLSVHFSNTDDFRVTLIDTGLHTLTAGRLKRIKEHIDTDTFFLTYGDGLADIDLKKELAFHQSHDKMATMTVIQPDGQFGMVEFEQSQQVTKFREKPTLEQSWINAGYFILDKQVFDILPDNSDELMWENEPLGNLAHKGQVMAYQHNGFWKCMDAMRDKIVLDRMWDNDDAKWKIW